MSSNKVTKYQRDEIKKKENAKTTKPHQAPADYTMYQIHKKRDYALNPLSASSSLFQQHLGQINYLASIKGAIIFQPPSYANESTQG